MPEKTQLLIYNPCQEQWGNMQPDKEGRYCGSCQKTVVDLTMMSDQEILAWFARGHKNICGRATEDQLNRDLVAGELPKKSRGAAVTLSLHMDQPGDYMVQLFSGGGIVVESLRMEGVDGPRTELMNIPGTLATGVYFVRVFHMATRKMYTEKVMVL